MHIRPGTCGKELKYVVKATAFANKAIANDESEFGLWLCNGRVDREFR